MELEKSIGFIGGGQMAEAMVSGAIDSGRFSAASVHFVEPNESRRKYLQGQFPNAAVSDSAKDIFEKCDKVILAVKPHVLKSIARDLAGWVKPDHLLVSIAAGISLSNLQEWLGTRRVVRVMPNTPALVCRGMSAFAADEQMPAEDIAWVESLLNSIGESVRVPDSLMHAVTAVSGSGPAYMFMILEALSDGGVAMGLPRQTAQQLATQTMLGAAALVKQTGAHPGQLKDQVASPGGTTIAAIRELESGKLRGTIMDAVIRCAQRSQELA